jgi:hypothetical protein
MKKETIAERDAFSGRYGEVAGVAVGKFFEIVLAKGIRGK